MNDEVKEDILEVTGKKLENGEELTDAELDKLQDELEATSEDIARILIDNKCPDCGTELMDIDAGIVCPQCVAASLSKSTLINSTFRIKNMLTLYQALDVEGYAPGCDANDLLKLIPKCLAGVNLKEELTKINATPPTCTLSRNVREFIIMFCEVTRLHAKLQGGKKLPELNTVAENTVEDVSEEPVGCIEKIPFK